MERLTITEAVDLLLILLEELRMQTIEEVGIVAIAAARLWVIDGIRHLDRMAREMVGKVIEARAATDRGDLVRRRAS